MKPPFPYWGGKQTMLSHILPLIPDHKGYIEPFFGGGAVFFAKKKAKFNIINDKLDYLVITYRTLATRAQEVVEYLKACHPMSRSEFVRLRAIKDSPLEHDPVEVAAAVIYCHRRSVFRKGSSFAVEWSGSRTRRMELDSILETQKMISEDVNIENSCGIKIVQGAGKYEENFIYVDPPYINTYHADYAEFSNDDYARLIEACRSAKAKVMLSGYWNDYMVGLVKNDGWKYKEVTRASDAKAGKNGRGNKVTEVLLMNYEHPAQPPQFDLQIGE